jgi:hypothetical protein
MAPVKEYKAPRSTCTAPVRASQARAFPSIARVSHHGIGEILVKYFVIKVYCPVPKFIGAVFVKKALFCKKTLFFAKTGFINSAYGKGGSEGAVRSPCLPLWHGPLWFSPSTPPHPHLPLWHSPLQFSPSDSAPSALEGWGGSSAVMLITAKNHKMFIFNDWKRAYSFLLISNKFWMGGERVGWRSAALKGGGGGGGDVR